MKRYERFPFVFERFSIVLKTLSSSKIKVPSMLNEAQTTSLMRRVCENANVRYATCFALHRRSQWSVLCCRMLNNGPHTHKLTHLWATIQTSEIYHLDTRCAGQAGGRARNETNWFKFANINFNCVSINLNCIHAQPIARCLWITQVWKYLVVNCTIQLKRCSILHVPNGSNYQILYRGMVNVAK